MFCKKGVLRNFAKFTGKHLCQSLFFNKEQRHTGKVGTGTHTWDAGPGTLLLGPGSGTRNRDPVYGTLGIQQIPVKCLPSTTINPANSIANFSNSSFTFEKYPVTTDSSLLIFGSE